MIDLQSWENSKLGQVITIVQADAGECSQVPISWMMALFPDAKRSEVLPQAGSGNGVDGWADKTSKYATWIANNPKDANQLPLPGDVLVIGPSKAINFPHTGVVKSASVSGYTLIQQNAPKIGMGVNDSSYSWNYRPVLGWFRPKVDVQVSAPAAPPVVAPPEAQPVASGMVGKMVVFPSTCKSWWTYAPDGPYDDAHHTHVLLPSKFGGYSRRIAKDLGNGVYVIETESYGQVAIRFGDPLTIQ